MKENTRKAARRAKNKALADKISGKGAAEPTTIEGDRVSLGNALSWYSSNTDKKQQKKWTIEWHTAQGDKDLVELFKKLPDWVFNTYGSVCRLKAREQWLDPNSTWFERRTEELKSKYDSYIKVEEESTEETPKKRVKTIQERIADKASEVGAEIEGELDDFCADGYNRAFKRSTNLLTLSPQVAKKLLPSFEPLLAELEELCGPKKPNDKWYDQLIEGYSHMKVNQRKAYRDFVKSIVEDLRKAAVVKARAPRVRKPKPPAQVVKYLKYKVKDEALGLSSVDKQKMVDATEIYLYNTKSRKLQYYVPQDGYLLTVRGTSILNFDPEKSGQKTVRKPEDLKSIAGATKLPMRKMYNSLKTKAIKLNGRVNDQCIIMGAFL